MQGFSEWKIELTQEVYKLYLERIDGVSDEQLNSELVNTSIIIMAINNKEFVAKCKHFMHKKSDNFVTEQNKCIDECAFTINSKTTAHDLFQNVERLNSYISSFTNDYIKLVGTVIRKYSEEKGIPLLLFMFSRRAGIAPAFKSIYGLDYYKIKEKMPWVENGNNVEYIRGRKISAESAYRQLLDIKKEFKWLSEGGSSPNDNVSKKLLSIFKELYPKEYEYFIAKNCCHNYEIVIDVLDAFHRIPRERIEFMVNEIIQNENYIENIDNHINLIDASEYKTDTYDESLIFEPVVCVVESFIETKTEDEKYILSNYSEDGYNIKMGEVEFSYSKILYYLLERKPAMKKSDVARHLGKTEEYVSRRWKNLITELKAYLKVRNN